MPKPPLPEAAIALPRKPNPAVISTLRRDGQPIAVEAWHGWGALKDNSRPPLARPAS
jgi:hypothetical protein